MASTPNSLGEVYPQSFLNDLAHSLVRSKDCTLLRSCSGRHQCGPYGLDYRLYAGEKDITTATHSPQASDSLSMLQIGRLRLDVERL